MEYKGQALKCSTLGNNITELIFDFQDGSVNKFDRNSLHELNEVVKQLEKDQSVKGLLISSGKDTFIVGADINQFLETFKEPLDKLVQWVKDSQKVFSNLENLNIPIVCAINGFALGGGFELCLACTYRVASTEAKYAYLKLNLACYQGLEAQQDSQDS